MPERAIRRRQVVADREHPILRVEKTWQGPCVILGASPTTPIPVMQPSNVVVPCYRSMGPVSQDVAAATLRRAAGVPSDIFVVELRTPSGVRTYGMLAVPQALEPRFVVDY